MNILRQSKTFKTVGTISIVIILFIVIGYQTFFQATAKEPNHKKEKKVTLAKASYNIETLFEAKDIVWGFDFIDENAILFTTRSGQLFRLNLKTNDSTPIKGTPEVFTGGQAGLLDVNVHPTDSSKIYLTYSEKTKEGGTTAVGYGTLQGDQLKNFKKIFSGKEPSSTQIHFGSRLVFDQKGHIFFSMGDRRERSYAQDLKYHNGKIMRLCEDGTVPEDNPFVDQKSAQPEIWTLGHRNPQGLTYDNKSGNLWSSEMGPRGGDELNLIIKGKNYGWPVITYGREYYGPKIGEGTKKEGMMQPAAYWVPSISPSGTAFYSDRGFDQWKNSIFLGTLSGQHLRQVKMNGKEAGQQLIHLKSLEERFRNVEVGPDNKLYLSTDSGKLIRLSPK